MASAHSEAAKMEQIVTEFYAKSLQIIWESRCGYGGGDQVRPRDRWFNLALRESSPAALESSGLRSHTNLEPMVVDIVLVQVGFDERVIERWVVRYQNSNHGNRRLSNTIFYKKTILLLRSLYVTVRLLPAYKVYHALNSSTQIRPFTLAHRVSSFVEPFTRTEEADMQRFVFTPVDTFSGRLCLWVQYHPWVPDIASSELSTPMSPQLISDYVGSPLTDPLKSFPSSLSSPTHPHLPDKTDPNFDLPNSLLRSDSAPVHIQNLRPSGASGSQNYKFLCVETRQCSGLKISCSSQRSGNDFELGDLGCPFDVDDDETRTECLEHRGVFSGHKSQDAAVGELVLMLRKAQPLLHHDTVPGPNNLITKTTGDALQELQAYRDLKNLLLTQGTISHI